MTRSGEDENVTRHELKDQLVRLLEDAQEPADIRAVDEAWEETERLRDTPIPWEDVKRDLGLG